MNKILMFFKKYRIANIVVLGVYLLVLICGFLTHELWRDEIQAWTIARDLSFVDIFKQMKWEGHPCLWHLILAIPAKLGLPVTSMGIVSLIFMFVTAILVMYKSPFHLPVKILLIFSSPFFYFFSIHSRVYSIIPFILCWLAIIYPKRMEKPILFAIPIFFLINTHIMMCVFIGFVILFYLIEIIKQKKYRNIRYLCSLGIIFLGIIILFLQVKESLMSNSIVSDMGKIDIVNSDNIISSIFQAIYFGLCDELYNFTGFFTFDKNILYPIVIGIVILIIVMLVLSFKTTCLSLVPYVFIFLLHSFIWFSISQRSAMIVIFLMIGIWLYHHDMNHDKTKDKIMFYVWEIILSIVCIISMRHGFNSYNYDIYNTVSGAEATAEFIEDYFEDDSLFICPVDYVATSITGYIDRDIFYSNIRKEYFTFATWDSYWRKEVTKKYFYSSILDFTSKHKDKDIYLIHSKYFLFSYDKYIDDMVKDGLLTPVYKGPWGLNAEQYWIYKYED